MTAPENPPAPAELTGRLLTATTELSDLYRDLYWLAREHSSPEQQQAQQTLDFDHKLHLKHTVDNFRLFLLKYIAPAPADRHLDTPDAAHDHDLLNVAP